MNQENSQPLNTEEMYFQKHLPRIKDKQLKIKKDKCLNDLSFSQRFELTLLHIQKCHNVSFQNAFSHTCRAFQADYCKIRSISGIDQNKSLKTLQLSHNLIEDLRPLRDMTFLISLAVDNNNITDIAPLSQLRNLKSLFLNQNNISGLYQIKDLQLLEILSASNNNITDLYGIQYLKNLKQINLNVNQISDLSPTAGCHSLNSVYAENNQITSVAPLLKMQTIKSISIQSNFISDLGIIELETHCTQVFVRDQQKPSEQQILLSSKMRSIYCSRTSSEKNRHKKDFISKLLAVTIQEVNLKMKQLVESQLSLSQSLLLVFEQHEIASQ
ncbi:leucine-rich_repeat domain-containing protein [Hexamita inflata]|uniref:Partial n=1 Tax=Hexamita inflata TaxID=28002 RepID=A0AA86Q5L8_9EUKA|nr:leucine-rich repeat domain-containing protein [Hexamita inflata]